MHILLLLVCNNSQYFLLRPATLWQHSGPWTLGQILPVIRFAWKTVAEMAENWDLGRGPPNITSSGSLEMVSLSTFIYERLQLTLDFTHGQLWQQEGSFDWQASSDVSTDCFMSHRYNKESLCFRMIGQGKAVFLEINTCVSNLYYNLI